MDNRETLERLKMLNSLLEDFLDRMDMDAVDDEDVECKDGECEYGECKDGKCEKETPETVAIEMKGVK